MSPEEYIASFKDDAVKEMLLNGVPASITLSQGMLESGNGNSALAVYANNHFGIKCHKGWTGESFIQDDDEKNECFRKYATVLESYTDHSNFLKSRSRYAFLFELKITDYTGWARGLKSAGYATDPRYAERLIEIIQRYELFEYDRLHTMPLVTRPKKKEELRIVKTYAEREVFAVNGRKAIRVKSGDTFESLTVELEFGSWQLYKYNDYKRSDKLKVGEVIFIQPKKNKSDQEFHVVKKGESLHQISQKYGVKLKKIYKYNFENIPAQPEPGTKVYLRKSKKEIPVAPADPVVQVSLLKRINTPSR